jgi:hypothetical protein
MALLCLQAGSQLPALETVSPISLGHSTSESLLLLVYSTVSDLDSYEKARTHLWGQTRIETFCPANGKDFLIINLTPVDLRRLNPRKIKILLVRSEYELAYNTLTECADAMRAVYLITGQPGIGG